MVLTYTPEGRPTQILKDLLLSYWDTRSNNEIPLPTILELSLIHISEPTRPERIGVGGLGV